MRLTMSLTLANFTYACVCLCVCVCVCVWREFAWWFWSIAGWWVVVSLCVRSGM